MPGGEQFENRRTFERKPVRLDATLTPLDFDAEDDGYTAPIEASTENISASGALFEFPVTPDNSTYYLIHLKTDGSNFPKFLLGQIKWSDDTDDDEGAIGGVEFILEEELTMDTVIKQLDHLPPEIYQFDRNTQEDFQNYLEHIAARHRG